MSMIAHAADRREQLVCAYGAGALDPALALLLETQAALSPPVALDLARANSTAGVFLEQQAPSPLDGAALERVLSRVMTQAPPRITPSRITGSSPAVTRSGHPPLFADELAGLPHRVRGLALDAAATRGWRFAGRGMKSLTLSSGGTAIAEILRIGPGAAAPRHTHAGDEYTLVLSGAFHDERGVYRAGDLTIADEDVTHRPTGTRDAVCYCLAVTDAPLRFTGALGLLSMLWKH